MKQLCLIQYILKEDDSVFRRIMIVITDIMGNFTGLLQFLSILCQHILIAWMHSSTH